LRAAFLEAVRLYPTVPALLRQTTAPTNWEGRVLDEGAGLVIYTPFFHRDTERLPHADRFRPEFWLGKDPADALPLLPFSFGPAACPGRHVVSLIGSTWLAVLLTEVRLALVEPGQLDTDAPLPGTFDHFAIRFQLSGLYPRDAAQFWVGKSGTTSAGKARQSIGPK
jgi:cytochrome P450